VAQFQEDGDAVLRSVVHTVLSKPFATASRLHGQRHVLSFGVAFIARNRALAIDSCPEVKHLALAKLLEVQSGAMLDASPIYCAEQVTQTNV
jgi:hypothetical protein